MTDPPRIGPQVNPLGPHPLRDDVNGSTNVSYLPPTGETGLHPLSGIQLGMTHDAPELVECGHRTPARLYQLARS
ncbi:hypothetical protein [Streptomyces sp. NPDC048386]|uniref:hypothetical protein n=1 Tax=Streptomyces sp. NPDC048386 TaxID=3365541 RepID=UPI003723974B